MKRREGTRGSRNDYQPWQGQDVRSYNIKHQPWIAPPVPVTPHPSSDEDALHSQPPPCADSAVSQVCRSTNTSSFDSYFWCHLFRSPKRAFFAIAPRSLIEKSG